MSTIAMVVIGVLLVVVSLIGIGVSIARKLKASREATEHQRRMDDIYSRAAVALENRRAAVSANSFVYQEPVCEKRFCRNPKRDRNGNLTKRLVAA